MNVLEGKVAIITGVSSGIGLETAIAFIAAGCNVLGVDLSPAPSGLQDTHFSFHQADLTSPSAPSLIVKAAKEVFGGRIDVLVNVAGIIDRYEGVETLSDEMWEKVMAVNLTAPVRLMREVVGVMKTQDDGEKGKGGSIVNVSSKAGISGAVAGVAYTASKHALVGVTKNTAWLYKDDGVRCNAVCPGAVKTNIVKGIDFSKWDMGAMLKMKPVLDVHAKDVMGEDVAEPRLCADVILFLASDPSRGVNGAIIPVDQG